MNLDFQEPGTGRSDLLSARRSGWRGGKKDAYGAVQELGLGGNGAIEAPHTLPQWSCRWGRCIVEASTWREGEDETRKGKSKDDTITRCRGSPVFIRVLGWYSDIDEKVAVQDHHPPLLCLFLPHVHDAFGPATATATAAAVVVVLIPMG